MSYKKQEKMDNETTLSLVEQIQKKILQLISEKQIQPGDTLPTESELSDSLDVSRVVVREALSSLRTLGIVETRRKKGTILSSPSVFGAMKTIVGSGTLDANSLRDLYELRLMLEVGMADFLFLKKTPENLEALERIVERERNAISTEESIQMDVLFHKTLYDITGNESLKSFQKMLDGLFSVYAPRPYNYLTKQIITHAGLIEVLRSGTPDSFRTAMRLHLNTQFEDMEPIMKTIYANEEKRKAPKPTP